MKNLRRYAQVQERLISPEGTFPPLGRSLSYRFGALQALLQAALLHNLADDLQPAQVRCALTAVMRRMIEVAGTFDENGWLQLGFVVRSPRLAKGIFRQEVCTCAPPLCCHWAYLRATHSGPMRHHLDSTENVANHMIKVL
jgi:hypothetical protein